MLPDGELDISFSHGGKDGYFAMIDGTTAGTVLTSTYEYNVYDNLSIAGYDLPITVRLSLKNGKLTVTCIKGGPLGGKTSTGGIREFE